MANLKNITDVPVAESAEGLNLIVNDNGVAKQIPASAVGKVKTINGVGPDASGNVQIDTASSWNDLKDKPFYVKEEVILEKQIVDGFIDEFDLGSAYEDLPPISTLVLGEKYVVFWDGQKYELTASGDNFNVRLDFGSNIFEPFRLVSSENNLRVATSDINTSHEIAIYRETVHKLDAKYLPDGVSYDVIVHADYVWESADASGPVATKTLIKGSYSELAKKLATRKPINGYFAYTVKNFNDEVPDNRFAPVAHVVQFVDGRLEIEAAVTSGELSPWIELYDDGTFM